MTDQDKQDRVTPEWLRIDLRGGKYTLLKEKGGGRMKALRYGEPWRDLTGDNLISALADGMEELQAEAEKWKSWARNEGEDLEMALDALLALKEGREWKPWHERAVQQAYNRVGLDRPINALLAENCRLARELEQLKSSRFSMMKCTCGHPACQDYWLVGIGHFCQGSGFTHSEASRIIDALERQDRRRRWMATALQAYIDGDLSLQTIEAILEDTDNTPDWIINQVQEELEKGPKHD